LPYTLRLSVTGCWEETEAPPEVRDENSRRGFARNDLTVSSTADEADKEQKLRMMSLCEEAW
jgi:hypothetical protein